MQDEKIKKSLIIESRLSLLALALQHKDSDIVEVIISKVLEQNDLDKEIVDIITNIKSNLKFKQFEHSINEINDYLHKKPTTIVKYEDKELKELKQQLKKLEIKFQQLIEEKTEYLNDIEEFNTQYNLHLGELIRTILNLKKEILYKKTIKNQKLKEQYKTNKNICEETKQTIDELQDTIVELEEILENIDESNENYDEINCAYSEIKKELEKLEEELLIQEEKLEITEKELKENEIFEKEYEEAKATYEQFDDEYEHIKDTQKDIIKLDEEQQKELKILFKKAAKLCHPDIVADELKEKALEIMQSLNDAYSKKDITLVKKILLSLENGTTFKTVSSDIEDKELLANKIKEFEQNISDLKLEIKTLKDDDTFTTISQLDNWDEYFEELRNELTEQKTNLEKEAMEVLAEKEEIEEWIQKLWNWADENNIPNGKLSRQKEKLLSITTIDFTGLKLKNICKEIFNLKNVTTFSLWDNDISFLPNEIVSFTNLKKLNLRGNPNLTITPFQQEWINNLRKESVVFIDEVRLLDDKYEMASEKLQVEQSIEEIINLVLKDFKNEHKIDLSTNYQIMLRIKDEAKKTANNLMNNTEAKFVLNYITYINNKPMNIEKTLIKEKFGFINIVNDKTVKNEHKPSYPQKDKDNKVVSENSSYSKHIQSIENPNFEKIRRYCNNLLNDNQADDMQEYLANNGKMYKAIIYDALEQFISKLDGEKISLVDWGCNQGIGSMLVFDYIKEKQLDIIVNQIILVDDNTTAISRAISQLEALKQNDIEVITIQSDDIDELEKLKNIKNDIILNLIVNDKFPVNYLNIDYEVFKNAYFMCVSNTNKAFVDDMYKNISDFSSVENISIRDSKIGKFEKFERIFKI